VHDISVKRCSFTKNIVSDLCLQYVVYTRKKGLAVYLSLKQIYQDRDVFPYYPCSLLLLLCLNPYALRLHRDYSEIRYFSEMISQIKNLFSIHDNNLHRCQNVNFNNYEFHLS